jgi:hypothetical protein
MFTGLDHPLRIAQCESRAVGEVYVRKQGIEELIAMDTLTCSNWRQYNQQERQECTD